MNIKINNTPTVLQDGVTLAAMAADRNLPEKGVAIAVNNEMIPRGEWGAYTVKEGDDIVILKAFCGG